GTVTHARDLTIGYLAQNQGLDSQNSIWAELDSVFAPLHELERQLHELENQLGTLTPKAADYQDVLASYDRLSE
ncbi:multidrug ABC transporter ATP-binding protein, partial [Coprococcus eutactus]|nr:multidrug ABC transporter ATP-binding protein [Coprococcus eutactus]